MGDGVILLRAWMLSRRLGNKLSPFPYAYICVRCSRQKKSSLCYILTEEAVWIRTIIIVTLCYLVFSSFLNLHHYLWYSLSPNIRPFFINLQKYWSLHFRGENTLVSFNNYETMLLAFPHHWAKHKICLNSDELSYPLRNYTTSSGSC